MPEPAQFFYNVNVFASFKADALVDPQQALMGYNQSSVYLNTVPAVQTISVSAHNFNQITQLTITSNNITNGDFGIFPIKYAGERINFSIQLQDLSGYDVKDYPLLNLYAFRYLLSGTNGTVINLANDINVNSNFGELSSFYEGGFFKGYFTTPLTASDINLIAVLSTIELELTGTSNSFSIYPSGGLYQLRKVNEDFDQTAAYNSLIYQPILIDKQVFFNQFLGQIVGNANSNPNTLGIEVFEKIANYVSNIDDIDYCNLIQLKSLLDTINATYQDFNYEYPPSLRRLTDILSVKHKRLFGQLNQYEQNFDNKGYTNSPKYGLNKGDKLYVDSTILSAGSGVQPSYILAYEKFSETYTPVNTNLLYLTNYLTTAFSVSTYSLSSYDTSWGWNLVLPIGVVGADIETYYDFYQFIPGIEGSLLQKFLDFDNPNNTLTITNSSYNDYIKIGGIMDEILLNNIYTNLEILS